jgi:uncharacterized protein YlxW (UPF0749 family)
MCCGLDVRGRVSLLMKHIENLTKKQEMGDDIEELIELNEAQERLKKEISKLESSIKRERQFNKKVDLNIKLQKKRKELERLKR